MNGLTDINDIGDFIYQTHSVKYAETILTQSGHKIKNVTLDMSTTGTRIKLNEYWSEAEILSKLRQEYGVTMDDYFYVDFNIIIELQ